MLPGTIQERLFPHATAAVTRRRSLRALGGATLAAATVALPDRAAARKKQRKGKTCQNRERQRCAIDFATCKATALANCPEPGTCGFALICCEECSALGFLSCALQLS